MSPPDRHVRCMRATIAFSLALSMPATAQETPCEGAGGEAVATVTGVVRDAATAVVLPGVRVMAVWSGGQVETVSDENGDYWLCELPAGVPVTAVASLAGLSGSPQQFQLEAGVAAALDLSIAFLGAADPLAETGRVVAQVRDALSGSPVQAAVVRVVGTSLESVADSAGVAVIDRVPAGAQVLEVRHLGYGEHEAAIDLAAGKSLILDVQLTADPVELEPIQVTVSAVRDLTLDIRGFYERQEWGEKLGMGTFFTEEDIERRRPRLITHMIADVQGARLDCPDYPDPGGCTIRFVRNTPGIGCQRAAVYINGSRVISPDANQTGPGGVDDLVRPVEIAGMEIYPSGASLPAEFGGSTGRCGAVVIWTK